MNRRTAKGLSVLIWIITFIAIMIFTALGNGTAGIVTLAVACVIELILARFLRCPHCGRGQGRSWLFAEYCPHCGEYLDDE